MTSIFDYFLFQSSFRAKVSTRPPRVLRREGRVSLDGRFPACAARPLHSKPQRGLPSPSPLRPPRGHPPQPQEALVHVGPRIADGGRRNPTSLYPERETGGQQAARVSDRPARGNGTGELLPSINKEMIKIKRENRHFGGSKVVGVDNI